MLYEKWNEWISAFEECIVNGNWENLKKYLTEDCIYVVTGGPLAVELRGRDVVIAGLSKSIKAFDMKFDKRDWQAGKVRVHEPNGITAVVVGTYVKQNYPVLRFGVDASWIFRGDKICLMTDCYDLGLADSADSLEWLDRHGVELGVDASYD